MKPHLTGMVRGENPRRARRKLQPHETPVGRGAVKFGRGRAPIKTTRGSEKGTFAAFDEYLHPASSISRIWAFIERCYDRDFQVRLTPEIAADICDLLEARAESGPASAGTAKVHIERFGKWLNSKAKKGAPP